MGPLKKKCTKKIFHRNDGRAAYGCTDVILRTCVQHLSILPVQDNDWGKDSCVVENDAEIEQNGCTSDPCQPLPSKFLICWESDYFSSVVAMMAIIEELRTRASTMTNLQVKWRIEMKVHSSCETNHSLAGTMQR